MNSLSSEINPQDVWIIDTDYSLDDQLAIQYLLTKANFNVIAITVNSVNCEVRPNIIKKKIEEDLQNYGKNEINVYSGADRAFIDYSKELKDDQMFDTYNIIKTDYSEILKSNFEESEEKNINVENKIVSKISNTAAVKIVELVRKYENKLNILTLGPLTNLSLAVLVDSSIKERFNNLFIVGGSYNNLGNSGTCAEYNFRADPVAAKNVLTYYKNVTLFPLELEHQIKFSTNKFQILKSLKSFPLMTEALNLIPIDEEESRSNYSFLSFFSSIILANLHDLTKVRIIRPCDVDIVGRYTRGGMAIEKYDYIKSGKFNNISIVEEINVERFLEIYFKI